jgi:hypothetical protein
LAAVPAFSGIVILCSQQQASADTVTTNQRMNCPIIGALDTPFTATDTPDPADPGGKVQLDVGASAPVPPGISVTINSLTLQFPLPAQVAKVDDVVFSGGNVTGSFRTAADNSSVSVVFTGPVSTDAISLPIAQVHVTLKPGTEIVSWPGPTGIATEIAGLGPQNCTAVAGNPPMQTTAIVGGPTPPTTNPTATTKSTTTSTPTTKPASTTPEAVIAAPRFTG